MKMVASQQIVEADNVSCSCGGGLSLLGFYETLIRRGGLSLCYVAFVLINRAIDPLISPGGTAPLVHAW